ncbi:MAG: polysaccharide biosynthesis protein [Rhodobacteraceae bacterium]|uniref:Polysaccharide export outer membrane protein n=1 Tax=Salipiger profundus TaxID=1229727 RepID=A0A1U7D3F2_9RHOB|nr:polysaccharide biosynthesis/export family protein [Salipiger profundus]APX22681.1 polysaccharide export outer membrane protein [Salipiger profundus]MAB05911.1 polysaccharide biosynthesis protein [Paracoccaceae bacterium]GGA10427.1 polysaccharide biosynthesis protein [Salipiger profundus]SFC64800.1 polysaccharide export outer membrane protein [Salipiger profundus]
MFRLQSIWGALAVVALISGCTLPRGAALQSEVVSQSASESPTFQVVSVTRANMPAISSWPRTGWDNEYGWPATSEGSNSHVIQTGDKVDITIWDSQENSLLTNATEKSTVMNAVEVGPNGAVFVPYVDQVFIRGLTPQMARGRIQDRLAQIAPSAQVQLSLVQGRSNSVELVGGVQAPGAYPMPSRNYKVLGLIADGGGISPSIRNPRVRLIRGGTTYETSASQLLESGRRNALLRPGDTVIIEQDDHSFTALGASGQEDLIYFPKDDLSALEAISLMGGLADSRADPKGILVLREYSVRHLRSDGSAPKMQQVVFTFDLTSADGLFAARNFRINPNDTVLATESPITMAQTVFSLVGTAFGLTRQATTLAN